MNAHNQRTCIIFLVLMCRAQTQLVPRNDAAEFGDPSHTPTVQILRPRPGELVAFTSSQGLYIVVAAPEGARVRLLVDGILVGPASSMHREGRVAGLAAGSHRIEALLLDVDDDVMARDYRTVRTCQCVESDAPLYSTPFLPSLDNPYQPSQRYMHHEVIYQFGVWEGAAEAGYLIDWLGVRTRYAWDCIKNGGYYKFVPSRRLECERYDRLHGEDFGTAAAHTNTHPYPHTHLQGFLPPVDDEYPEYVDMLSSVVRSKGQHYTVVELGSSYGTWGVRAVAAQRRMYPNGSYHLMAVESGQHRYKQLLQHVKANNVNNHTLLHGFITDEDERAKMKQGGATGVPSSHSPYAVGEPHAITLTQLLADHHHIDYLDFDIQGAELQVFLERASLDTLNHKVQAVHIGTHAPYIHQQIRAIMLNEGWGMELDLQHNPRMVECDATVLPSRTPDPTDTDIDTDTDTARHTDKFDWLQRDASCLTQTEQGPMYVRDGLLSFYNPNFGAFYQ